MREVWDFKDNQRTPPGMRTHTRMFWVRREVATTGMWHGQKRLLELLALAKRLMRVCAHRKHRGRKNRKCPN